MSTRIQRIHLPEVDSTNEYASVLARAGEPEIVVISADAQTAGRGTRGKYWLSPHGAGVYVSLLLRPRVSLDSLRVFPMVCALGVARVLSRYVALQLKWPNDILVNGKKICGILVETCSHEDEIDFVIAGIGVNINSRLSDVPACATSLFLETGAAAPLDAIRDLIIHEQIALYADFIKGKVDLDIVEGGLPHGSC